MPGLPTDLESFTESARAARAPGFDWRKSFLAVEQRLPAQNTRLRSLFMALLSEVEREFQIGRLNAYHNPFHTLDTLHAIHLLHGAAGHAMAPEDLPVLLITMLGHDILHPGGSGAHAGELEQISADKVADLARLCGVDDVTIASIHALILSTRPSFQINIRRGNATGTPAQTLIGDADVMASLLPDFGLVLSADLTREFAASGEPVARPFEEPASRLAFLKAYQTLSPAAEMLGLGALVRMQIRKLETTVSD